MNRKMACRALSVALAGLIAAGMPSAAFAKDAANCVSSDEAAALRLRDLQSRLMVAALSCNQQAAYNSFVEKFRPSLTSAGLQIVAYFKRTGGGEPALNRHLTQLANAAGLSRAEKPEQYCGDTWTMFLRLEEEPQGLPTMAAMFAPGVAVPAQCSAPDAPLEAIAPAAPVLKAATAN
ncbi:MAG: hypothetical protein K1X51_17935 [Rhodospirillaceae bacterium]|nr:hypothetical protein [Rhodospirillaceae bacterium]